MDKSLWDASFRSRFARHGEELAELYNQLYPNNEQAWAYFAEMLHRCWEQRSDPLRALDEAREADPAWYKGHELVGMLMYVSAFAGTLRGVREKLDYIEECGVKRTRILL